MRSLCSCTCEEIGEGARTQIAVGSTGAGEPPVENWGPQREQFNTHKIRKGRATGARMPEGTKRGGRAAGDHRWGDKKVPAFGSCTRCGPLPLVGYGAGQARALPHVRASQDGPGAQHGQHTARTALLLGGRRVTARGEVRRRAQQLAGVNSPQTSMSSRQLTGVL